MTNLTNNYYVSVCCVLLLSLLLFVFFFNFLSSYGWFALTMCTLVLYRAPAKKANECKHVRTEERESAGVCVCMCGIVAANYFMIMECGVHVLLYRYIASPTRRDHKRNELMIIGCSNDTNAGEFISLFIPFCCSLPLNLPFSVSLFLHFFRLSNDIFLSIDFC